MIPSPSHRAFLPRIHACIGIALALAFCGAPRRLGAENILIKGAVIHTVSGSVISPGQIWIKDAKIQDVGERIDAPEAVSVDLTGQHVYPGLIAASTALGLTEIGAIRATHDMREVGKFNPDVRSWIAMNPDSELIPVARANGIAHIVPTPQGGLIAGHSGLVALEGWTMELMVAKKPLALHVEWPEMNLDTTPKDQFRDKAKWKSPEDLAKDRRKDLAQLESFFQDAAAYVRARDNNAEVRPQPAWEAMRPCLRGDIPVVVHADDLRAIQAAVQWARTNQLRLIISGGRDASLAASLLASNQVSVIFEHVFTRSLRDTEPYDHLYHAPAALQQAGVTIALSAGTGEMSETEIRNLPYHAAQAVAYGMRREDALKTITLNPAKMFGVADRLGSIEKGKEATLIATDGDLLDIRSHVTRMWIAGQPSSLETRHTRLYEKYRRRPNAR
ncbi:MAG: amidohydrolase family protein [Verrucomicrobia bacterium]|nr:amidohydrolase family protein [Verrucomicrobiota bacterium]MBI3868916.1 amidohydrolase family protein [Verrucomicrobiota bacterium]